VTALAVAAAGAVGALLRWRIGVAVGVRTFPWATLGINVVGSFALAAVLAGPATRGWSPTTTTAVAVGLLGAFTTFSTFGYETLTMLRDERVGAALAYVLASVVLGVAAAAAGYVVGRELG
jgi:CrcB protein